jgi:hypothetical protein
MIQLQKPMFAIGRLVATPGALSAIETLGLSPFHFVSQHAQGEWGDGLDDEDKLRNDEALKDGSRIFSSYLLENNEDKLWCITEAEDENGMRVATTLLLSSEY